MGPAGVAKASTARVEVFESHSEAGYFSRERTRSAATVLTVPRVDCRAVAAGHAAGQSYGITLEGKGLVANPWAAVRRPRVL